MSRLLGNLRPQILVQALRYSMPRQATILSSLKVRSAHGGTRGSSDRNRSGGRQRGSGISHGRGGQHNEVVPKNDDNNGSKRKDEDRVEVNAAKKVGN